MRTVLFSILILLTSFLIFINYDEIQNFAINVQKYEIRNEGKNNIVVSNLLKVLSGIASVYPQKTLLSRALLDRYYEEFKDDSLAPQDLQDYIYVSSVEELQMELDRSIAGHVFVLASGNYDIAKNTLDITRSGSFDAPITIVGENRDKTVLSIQTTVGINVNASNIVIKNLKMKGACDYDSSCEHAVHIFGDADGVSLIGNEIVNFNAHIKINGNKNAKNAGYPDFGLLENNLIYNEWVRDTNHPVTPIDLVAANGWSVKHNFIADFAKAKGDKIAYGGFFKGGGRDSVFSNNIVACEWRLKHMSFADSRVGFSIGGGGTGEAYKRDGVCDVEYCNADISYNTIVNCQNDSALYLNQASDIRLVSNTFKATMGLQMREGVND